MIVINILRDTIGATFIVIGIFFLTHKGKVQLVKSVNELMEERIEKNEHHNT